MSRTGTEVEAPARRRRWYEGTDGTLAVLLAGASDVDDLVPTLVAYQIEWNKLPAPARGRLARRDEPDAGRRAPASSAASSRTGRALKEAWGTGSPSGGAVAERTALRLRMLGGRRSATPG